MLRIAAPVAPSAWGLLLLPLRFPHGRRHPRSRRRATPGTQTFMQRRKLPLGASSGSLPEISCSIKRQSGPVLFTSTTRRRSGGSWPASERRPCLRPTIRFPRPYPRQAVRFTSERMPRGRVSGIRSFRPRVPFMRWVWPDTIPSWSGPEPKAWRQWLARLL